MTADTLLSLGSGGVGANTTNRVELFAAKHPAKSNGNDGKQRRTNGNDDWLVKEKK